MAKEHGVYNLKERDQIQAEFIYRDDGDYAASLDEAQQAEAFNDNRLDINDF